MKESTAEKKFPNPEWRKCQIILEPELIQKLYDWHGGQDSAVYSLASTGHEHLVSLSMIDAAMSELELDLQSIRGKKRRGWSSSDSRDEKDLKKLLGDLAAVRSYWREFSAQESGMDLEEDEYTYDRADRGLDPEEEAEIDTSSH